MSLPSPTLPTELWRTILRDATCVPTLLDTEWKYTPDDRLWVGWETLDGNPDAREEILRSDATKRSIVLVCRAWRDMGVEFLYETVQLPREEEHNTVMFVEILKRSASTSYVGHGWWAKRIRWTGDALSEDSVETIVSLLELCHNLQIFVIFGNTVHFPAQSRLASTLQSRFSHSLRRFEIVTNNLGNEDGVKYADTLPDLPLTSLSITARSSLSDQHLHARFETITTLTVYMPGASSTLPNHWHLPMLRHLSLDHFNQDEVSMLLPFVKRHHQTLTNLHLRPTGRECDIPLLASQAPNIRSLAFPFAHLQLVKRLVQRSGWEGPRLFGITHLGISKSDTPNYLALIGDAMEGLLDCGVFPSLVVLCVLQSSSPANTEELTELSLMLQRRGIHLEDSNGRCVQ